jgi:phage shock protein A
MSDFFKKLNVLVRSNLNNVLGDAASANPLRRAFNPTRLGNDVDREVAAMRSRINDAIVREDRLKAEISQLQGEIARLDPEADRAVQQDQETAARQIIAQMQTLQRRLSFAQSELREHESAVQEYMQRVNALEAYIVQVRQAQEQRSTQPLTSEAQEPTLSELLREANQQASAIRDPDQPPQSQLTSPTPSISASDDDVDDDLAERRQRLSKRS